MSDIVSRAKNLPPIWGLQCETKCRCGSDECAWRTSDRSALVEDLVTEIERLRAAAVVLSKEGR